MQSRIAAFVASLVLLTPAAAGAQAIITSHVSSPMAFAPLGGYQPQPRIALQMVSGDRIGERYGLAADLPLRGRWSVGVSGLAGEHVRYARDSTTAAESEEPGLYAAGGLAAWRSLVAGERLRLSAGGGAHVDWFEALDAVRFTIPVGAAAELHFPVGDFALVPLGVLGIAARFDDLEANRAFENQTAEDAASHFGWFLTLASRLELGPLWLQAGLHRSIHLASDAMGVAPVQYREVPSNSFEWSDDENVVRPTFGFTLQLGRSF